MMSEFDYITCSRKCGGMVRVPMAVYSYSEETLFVCDKCIKEENSVNKDDKLGFTVDPKQSQAIKKMGFTAVPISLLLHAQPGNQNGADKYGIYNWLKLEDESMSMNTYLDALQRHLILFRAGQDHTSDTDINNLDSMISGLAVLRDAMLFGKVKDDRTKLSPQHILILEKLLNREGNNGQ